MVSWVKGVGEEDGYGGMKGWEVEGMVYDEGGYEGGVEWVGIEKRMEDVMGVEVKE